MKISVVDGSSYFKGLLLLLRKDKKVTSAEIDLMKRIGKTLGFEREFCDHAISEILDNTFIVDIPHVFYTKELTMKFVMDGLAVAFSDNEIHPLEEQWLRSTVEINGLDVEWFSREKENMVNRKRIPGHLEVDDLTVTY